MKPSPHFVRYNAQDYAERGFLEVSGRVRDMAQKPRHWQITATAPLALLSAILRARQTEGR